MEALRNIPSTISDSQVITYLHSKKLGKDAIGQLKSISNATDKIMSAWFDVSEKTFQNYKNSEAVLSINFREKLLLLLSLFNHGESVFGSMEEFNHWINQPNFYFDNKTPIDFFQTISGIRYVDDRLTGMAYGDNA